MTSSNIEDYDRLARGNEDRFEQVEKYLNDALENWDDKPDKAKEQVEQAAYLAAGGVRLNMVASQKKL